ncbi:universal stress protein [Oxalobacter sp. OttesenSCG-928-P03]|nr:universal stress protein [Oxalobacter sp. OttesenSCG-928-P03]
MFKKILIPTDGSPLANQAALEGITLAKQIGAEVVCIYIARENQNPAFDFSDLPVKNNLSADEYKELVATAGNALMLPLREAAEKDNVTFTKLIEISNMPASRIVQTAEENGCDLIFMGSQGSAGWASRLLGSVAAKVVALSEMPVTVYKVKKAQVPPKAKINIGVLPI